MTAIPVDTGSPVSIAKTVSVSMVVGPRANTHDTKTMTKMRIDMPMYPAAPLCVKFA
ncbi:hypothetical protein D3C72_2464080 [compost metagenome]